MVGMAQNCPKSDPRWNEGYSGTGLHAGTKNFGHFSRNGTVLITMHNTTSYSGSSNGGSSSNSSSEGDTMDEKSTSCVPRFL